MVKRTIALCSGIVLCFAPALLAKVLSVPNEYNDIQEGMDAASDGDTVLVSEGTYYERIDFCGKPIVVASNFIFDHDLATILNTVINADTLMIGYSDKGSVVTFAHAEDDRSRLEGFTITKGTGTRKEIASYDSYLGGGIYAVSSSPVIEFNSFVDNSAMYPGIQRYTDGCGGGMYFDDCAPTIRQNSIEGNEAFGWDYYGGWFWEIGSGGGIYMGDCQSGVIEKNIISANSTVYGTGVFFDNSQTSMRGNWIRENGPIHGEGGGIYCFHNSSPEIVNNRILRNDQGGIECA